MGLFEKIFSKKEITQQTDGFFKLLNGYAPVFTSWNGGVYESELIRSSIDARARNIAKLKIEVNGSANPMLTRRLKKAPNEWQTWYQFLYRLSTILDISNNAFIVPVLDEFGTMTGVYPIYPQSYEVVKVNQGGREIPFIRFTFETGNRAAIELDRVGILTKFQYKSDYFGESNSALNDTMELMHIQTQGINEGVKSSASYRFMATLNNFANDEDLRKERERFSAANLRRGGGLLLFPNTYKDIKQVTTAPFVLDASQSKLIENKVYGYFGVNEDILQNKAYGDSWSAFYEGAIEPFAVQFSEVMTRMLFTMRERTEGNEILATSNRIQYMAINDKLNFTNTQLDRGIINRDEAREVWNLSPLSNGEGQAYIIRGEYWNANDKINEGESNNE